MKRKARLSSSVIHPSSRATISEEEFLVCLQDLPRAAAMTEVLEVERVATSTVASNAQASSLAASAQYPSPARHSPRSEAEYIQAIQEDEYLQDRAERYEVQRELGILLPYLLAGEVHIDELRRRTGWTHSKLVSTLGSLEPALNGRKVLLRRRGQSGESYDLDLDALDGYLDRVTV